MELRNPTLRRIGGVAAPAILLGAFLLRHHAYVIDDAYISFRYARNLVAGHGLVFNVGERVEGYSNLAWTLLLAMLGALRASIVPSAQLLGAAFALATVFVVRRLSEALRPIGRTPCVATWAYATSTVTVVHATAGLETSFYAFLVAAAVLCIVCEEREDRPPRSVLWGSGAMFALAAWTRPEAPVVALAASLGLGARFVSRRNALRFALLAGAVVAQLAFRGAYYGGLVSNAVLAKGVLHAFDPASHWVSVEQGADYAKGYVGEAGVLIGAAALALGVATRRDQALLRVPAAAALAIVGGVTVLGGDWMPHGRMFAAFEPLVLVLACVGIRTLTDSAAPELRGAIGGLVLLSLVWRAHEARAAVITLEDTEARFWAQAAGGTSQWLNDHAPRGARVALTDIGYVGWATDLPLLDLAGLTDAPIARLPGRHFAKASGGVAQRFFAVNPEYFVMGSPDEGCSRPWVPPSAAVFFDPRFGRTYAVAARVPTGKAFWCVFARRTM